MNEMSEKILVHCCCGPCSTVCLERLIEDGWDVSVFYGNSNIYPEEENNKRWENLLKVVDYYKLKSYRATYNHAGWLSFVKGLEEEKEGGKRCLKCFEYNFTETARLANQLKIENITTTLTVSPYKNSNNIFRTFELLKNKNEEFKDIMFLNFDFKKKDGYKKSIELSEKLNLYRQNYCGCEFSMREEE